MVAKRMLWSIHTQLNRQFIWSNSPAVNYCFIFLTLSSYFFSQFFSFFLGVFHASLSFCSVHCRGQCYQFTYVNFHVHYILFWEYKFYSVVDLSQFLLFVLQLHLKFDNIGPRYTKPFLQLSTHPPNSV